MSRVSKLVVWIFVFIGGFSLLLMMLLRTRLSRYETFLSDDHIIGRTVAEMRVKYGWESNTINVDYNASGKAVIKEWKANNGAKLAAWFHVQIPIAAFNKIERFRIVQNDGDDLKSGKSEWWRAEIISAATNLAYVDPEHQIVAPDPRPTDEMLQSTYSRTGRLYSFGVRDVDIRVGVLDLPDVLQTRVVIYSRSNNEAIWQMRSVHWFARSKFEVISVTRGEAYYLQGIIEPGHRAVFEIDSGMLKAGDADSPVPKDQ